MERTFSLGGLGHPRASRFSRVSEKSTVDFWKPRIRIRAVVDSISALWLGSKDFVAYYTVSFIFFE